MQYVWIIIGLAAIAAFTLFLLHRKKKTKAENTWQESAEARIWRVYREGATVETVAGHTLHYEAGLELIDSIGIGVAEGVDRCFTKFECAYPNVTRAHRIHVVVLRSEPDSQGNPCYRVAIQPGNPYYNSEWDKMKGSDEFHHYILVALP